MRFKYCFLLNFLVQAQVAVDKYPRDTEKSAIVEQWAAGLQVQYETISNLINTTGEFPTSADNQTSFDFTIKLTYNGAAEIVRDWPWSIYFYMDQTILRKNDSHITEPVSIGQGLDVRHVNGYLWRLSVNSNWVIMGKDDSRIWTLRGLDWINADSTLFPNWYFACDDVDECDPVVIQSTVDLTFNKPNYVVPFSKIEQQMRFDDDQFSKPTAKSVFEENQSFKGNSRYVYGLPMLPQPNIVNLAPNTNQVDKNGKPIKGTGIAVDSNIWKYSYVTQVNFDCDNPICTCTGPDNDQDCTCKKFQDLQEGPPCRTNCNAWRIEVGYYQEHAWLMDISSSIRISARDCASVDLAVTFITKLIQRIKSNDDAMLFSGSIADDGPRFETRSLFIDHARNFHGVEPVLTLLDVMESLEMNQLHMKLSDDEGWRIEVDGIPELTEIASKRCHDPTGDNCLMPQLGSGPSDDTSGSGFFTKKDYSSILARAQSRKVRIVPEIGGPGHNGAAVMAMEARARKNDTTYRLIDPEQGLSSDASVQGYYNNVMNPCINSTWTFLDKVTDQIYQLHQSYMDQGTHDHFHIGGDETNMSQLEDSPACVEYMQIEGISSYDDLLHNFFKKYMTMVADKGFHIDAWEEVFKYETSEGLYDIYDPQMWELDLSKIKLTGYHWYNRWLHYDAPTTGYMMANKGYDVILTPSTHTYLDHAQYPDPNARGLMWATRFSNLWKTFSFRPMDMYKNGLYDESGYKINSGCEPGTEPNSGNVYVCAPLNKPENIVGISGSLWSEEVISEEYLWNQMFPRAFAIAERSWKNASWESLGEDSRDVFDSKKFVDDFETFRYAMQFEILELENRYIDYHLPKPGGKPVNGNWNFNNLYTYNDIRFRAKGTQPWAGWPDVKQWAGLDKDMEMVTATYGQKANGQPLRTSVPIEFNFKIVADPSSALSISSNFLLTVILIFMIFL